MGPPPHSAYLALVALAAAVIYGKPITDWLSAAVQSYRRSHPRGFFYFLPLLPVDSIMVLRLCIAAPERRAVSIESGFMGVPGPDRVYVAYDLVDPPEVWREENR